MDKFRSHDPDEIRQVEQKLEGESQFVIRAAVSIDAPHLDGIAMIELKGGVIGTPVTKSEMHEAIDAYLIELSKQMHSVVDNGVAVQLEVSGGLLLGDEADRRN